MNNDYNRIELTDIKSENESLNIVLDELPIACFALDKNGKTVYCNNRAVVLYGADSKEELMANIHTKYAVDYQENGLTNQEYDVILIETTLREGSHVFEWLYKHANGEVIPVESEMKNVL